MLNFSDKFFYHIYPFGFCGVPYLNTYNTPAGGGLDAIAAHAGRIAALGVNALYIGPLFESSSHGYDTVDYYHVDRRLGNNESLRRLVCAFHSKGIAVILDAVFNHTGRDFFAFKDLQTAKAASRYAGWYAGLDWTRDNQHGDGFSYEGWAGHTSLVKLNLECNEAREHLINAALYWIDEFDIDGLRLDAANVMSVDFMRELSCCCKAKKSGFWLMGEAVGEDYRALAHEGCLDSVTNYEFYKSLWSSFNDKNFFELSWTFKRAFYLDGLYSHIALYNFAENHDVNRVASALHNKAHLYPLYGILFCAPGIPSLYYGGEYGVHGERGAHDDHALRPVWQERWKRGNGAADLERAISVFAKTRRESNALKYGSCRELYAAHEQFAFARETEAERVLIAVNAAPLQERIVIARDMLPSSAAQWEDILSGEVFTVDGGVLPLPLAPSWIRILRETA
ncbi:MAG: alpha-amylase [Spirochaetaceae bacterium]|jgi:glycosidase|nr:alpha-amylase [Spirochaetaceae bacterium]